MMDVSRIVDVYSARAKAAKEAKQNFLHFMLTRWQLWYECQQRALKEFNRIVLSNPDKYGTALPGSLKRAANEAGRKARAKFVQDVIDDATGKDGANG